MIAYKDIADVEFIFKNLTHHRLRKLLNWSEAQDISDMVVGRRFRTEGAAIQAVLDHYLTDEVPECNCPPANGRRWHISPVKYYYDNTGEQFNYLSIIFEIFSEIMAVCGINVQRVLSREEANIVIDNGFIDGEGGTLGVTYVPASGEDMAACGPMCGNIRIDIEGNFTRPYLKTVMTHEILHALGIAHNADRRSIMYFQYLGPRGLHQIDIDDLLRRYPRNLA